jgi:phage antirepressor YoqD-like protein
LISRSNAFNAEPFQDWVCEDVLPTIRKTGSYGHNSQQQFDPHNLDPDVMLDALINVQQLRKQEKAKLLELQEEKAKLEVRLEAQTPVVNAIMRLAASEGSVCIQQAAKALKMRPTDLTEHMLNSGWLYMRPPSTRKIAYQSKIKQKWMVCHQDTKSLSGGRELFYVQYKITGLGLLRLSRELDFKIDEIESNDD